MMPRPSWLDAVELNDVLGAVLALLLIGGLALAVFKLVHPLMVRLTGRGG